MSLASYASACNDIGRELRLSMTEDEIDELRADCKNLKARDWYIWRKENRELILWYLKATPSAREKRKGCSDPVLKRRLVLASLQFLHNAQGLLESANELQNHIGLSYRNMAVVAFRCGEEILSLQLEHWPLDDPNPFERI
jgi:hypothetical protein